MVGQMVIHRKYGTGTIVESRGCYIKVRFGTEPCEKVFQYPGAFEQYITFEDDKLQSKVNADLEAVRENKRREDQQRRLEYERLDQERKNEHLEQLKRRRKTAREKAERERREKEKQKEIRKRIEQLAQETDGNEIFAG